MSSSAKMMALLIEQLEFVFSPNTTQPPLGGGAEEAWLFGWADAPIDAWHGHFGENCANPMVWARPNRWWYSGELQTGRSQNNVLWSSETRCGTISVLTIEAGIYRCASVDILSRDEYEDQALVQLDDSRRLRRAMCRALSCAEKAGIVAGYSQADTVPWGPEGAVIGMFTQAHIALKGE